MNEKKLNEQLDASWENALAFLKACITGEKPRLRRLVETLEKKSSEIMVSNERLQEENISLKKQLESATNAEKHYKTVSENNKKDLQRIKNEYSDLQALNKLLWNFFQKISVVKVALTGKINDREMFMKGIDYSYYYESDTDGI